MILKCKDPKDRDALVVILARNGYTVRMGRRKMRPQDKTQTAYVEITGEDDDNGKEA